MNEQNGLFTIQAAPVILAFPNLFEPKVFKRSGKETDSQPTYSASFVFDPGHPDFAGIKALAVKLARLKWPGLASPKDLHFPWESGDAVAARRVDDLQRKGKTPDSKGDYQRGKIVLKTASKYQPGLGYYNDKGQAVQIEANTPAWIAAKGKFFFGAECHAQINLVPYDRIKPTDQDGIKAYLNMVVVTGGGTKLAGGASVTEVFKGYVGATTTEDPTAGADGWDA